MNALRDPGRHALRAGFMLAIAVTAFTAAPGTQLLAQDNPRIIRGTVVDEETGNVIEGALLELLDERDRPMGVQAVSSPAGAFQLQAPGPGVFAISVQRLGFGMTYTPRFEVPETGPVTVRVLMTMRPIEIDAIEVDGTQIDWARRGFLREFYQRVETGTGRYLTREDIEPYDASTFLDLVRMMPGFTTVQVGQGQRLIIGQRSARSETRQLIRGEYSRVGVYDPIVEQRVNEQIESGERDFDLMNTCPVSFFLDGRPLNPGNNPSYASVELAYMLNADEIAGVEFYSGPSTTPATFTGADAGCGVIAIWTIRSNFEAPDRARRGGGG